MPLSSAPSILARLKTFQAELRGLLLQSRAGDLHHIDRSSPADTIYRIDQQVEPLIESFCNQWAAEEGPLILIAEGMEGGHGGGRVFPKTAKEEDAAIRLIIDPIDGTRGLMYDKRAAWTLAGVAPNRGASTRLRDIEVAVMTELPTSKMGRADTLWAIKGQGAHGERVDLATNEATPLTLAPSQADTIEHGFAMVAHFFPTTKPLAGELMQEIARALVPHDPTHATIFDDQYISTAGQLYELIVGHDRFNADLRPVFYRMLNINSALACHPYDCATALIAEEAGVILTDEHGAPLDGPLDTTTGLCWVAYANVKLRQKIEPVLLRFPQRHCRS